MSVPPGRAGSLPAASALGTGAPQTGAILGVLGNALTVAASTSTGGTGDATNAVTGLPAGGNTLPMSTGGVAPALRANVISALVTVASGLLTGAPPGGSASTSSASADATDRTPGELRRVTRKAAAGISLGPS